MTDYDQRITHDTALITLAARRHDLACIELELAKARLAVTLAERDRAEVLPGYVEHDLDEEPGFLGDGDRAEFVLASDEPAYDPAGAADRLAEWARHHYGMSPVVSPNWRDVDFVLTSLGYTV